MHDPFIFSFCYLDFSTLYREKTGCILDYGRRRRYADRINPSFRNVSATGNHLYNLEKTSGNKVLGNFGAGRGSNFWILDNFPDETLELETISSATHISG